MFILVGKPSQSNTKNEKATKVETKKRTKRKKREKKTETKQEKEKEIIIPSINLTDLDN
jgi:hypothetical protein